MSKKITQLNDFRRDQIYCPHCKSPSIAPHTPFCSRRCARVDLGKWLNEAYVISSYQDDGDFDSVQISEQEDKEHD